ncbi:probable protein phosphatase 2C 60 [Galendromus occidentalis]|uniref:protein-serine/threonine phosphatase n=1 Tax=Galendromus occidentalis TaxID=34638 RepID=A0AAJ6VVC1_9ACAR|nr:probable protein phosphatase 2C 60 [Galendromus occidentalis]
MGAYRSRPIFEPESSSGSGRGLSFGASSVQGWRTSQEDAHNCIIDFDDDCSFFAVYDGHGGSEVSKYCSLHLPIFVKTLSSYKAGDFKQALIDAFLKFDQTLTEPGTIEILKQLAQYDSADEGDAEEVIEETDKLHEEARMPLEEILNIYKKAREEMKNRKKEANGTDEKADGDSMEEAAVGDNNDDSSEAVAKVTDKKSQGDQKDRTETSKPKEEKNGVAKKDPEEPKDVSKAIAAGSSSDEVASSATKDPPAPSNAPLGRGGRAAAQKARRIITDEENNNNNGDDEDDEESESSSEEDSEDPENVDDDDAADSSEEDEDDEDDDEEDDDEIASNEDVEVFDSDVPGSGSGSTAVVALLKGNLLTVANAGDSRAIICRNGKAIDMSVDHKPEDAAERMRIERAGGKITADGRVNRGLNLSRAIGDHVYKQNRKFSLAEQMISPLPDVQSIVIDRKTDEFLILACDGIWNCMTSQEVCDFVSACYKQGDKLTDICEQLFRRCIAPDTSGDGTGCDNMTCIIVRLSEESCGSKRQSDGNSEEQKQKKSRSEDASTEVIEDGGGGSSSNNQ